MSRRGPAGYRLVLGLAALLAAAGCNVDPFCLTCDQEADGGDGGGDTGLGDGGSDASDDGGVDSAVATDSDVPMDARSGDGCLVGELCNDEDDDCDGLVDEGFDFDDDPTNCGGCLVVCGFVHSFAMCVEGSCEMGGCDVGFLDLNEDPDDGCEYRCLPTADDDSLCDLRDGDCDGLVDEDVDLAGDPINCGGCGRVCRAPHADAACSAGVCALGMCGAGFFDVDGNPDNGCEYSCTPASPAAEVCNVRDDDCDGTVDEGDPGGGAACGDDTGLCSMGVARCEAGRIVCDGEVIPTAETCNGEDDDCDGMTDESNPEGGRICSASAGLCEVGTETCMGGALVCVGAVGAAAEVCNNLDDDCDGSTDEGNPDGGAACGPAVGACTAGAQTCVAGAIVCMGGTTPEPELCNMVDDDCDGSTDEGDPEAGDLCGTDVGTCVPGVRACSAGTLSCVGAIGAGVETCNGQDDDCDGSTDEGNPGGGGSCGTTTGACSAGAEMCTTGTLVCSGGVGPVAESCNTIDDDCDGTTDEDFSLMTDVNNCGGCGATCSFTNGVAGCLGGSCVMVGCLPGFVDLDAGVEGCEYACSFRGSEICNGVDDDCDGTTDVGLSIPSGFCNPNGVCAGTTAVCAGAAGYTCTYPSTFEVTETLCDSLDNDCDGATDETYPLVGTACSNGIGACRRSGSYACTGPTSFACDAAAAGTPADEECDGFDNDCDGSVDERVADDPGTAWRDGVDLSAIATVVVDRPGGGTMNVMQYEASRPDATSTDAGTVSNAACSSPDRMPWTRVTWTEARDACCAMNSGGACPGATEVGWRLCSAPEWESACEGPSDSCTWSYASTCDATQQLVCNGREHDCDPAAAGDQDCLYTTGSPTFPGCRTVWPGGSVYDMSGNVREWTDSQPEPGLYQVRGGAYTNIEAGRRCGFDFAVAPPTFNHPNTGFRCCHY